MKICYLILSLFFLLNVDLTGQNKKRIAVFTFEDKSISNWSDIGDGLADMVATELVKSGSFMVLERQQLKSLLQEYSLGLFGLLDPATVVETGKMIGVDYAVFGAVTEYGVNVDHARASSFGLSASIVTHTARVGLDIRMVNTLTGEIIAAENIVKTVVKRKSNIMNAYSNSGFDETIVGEAARDAVIEVVNLLSSQVKSQKTAPVPVVQFKILMTEGQDVFIVGGQQQNVKPGDIFSIYVSGAELIDEDTGISYGFLEKEVGLIEVIDPTISNGKVSKCIILSGADINKEMLIKKVQPLNAEGK